MRQSRVRRLEVDRGRSTTPLPGVGAELRVVHAPNLHELRVRGEVRFRRAVSLAIQHPVRGPGHAQDPERLVADVSVAVRRQEHEPVDPTGVVVRVPAGHRPAKRMAADVPGLDVGVTADDRSSRALTEDGEVQGHLRDENRHVRSTGQRCEGGQIRVGVNATARIEDQTDIRFAARWAHHVPAGQSLDLDRRIRLDALERRVRPAMGRFEVRHRQFEAEPGHDEERQDGHEEPSLPVSAAVRPGPGQPPDDHVGAFERTD